jgi:hypothetical protein
MRIDGEWRQCDDGIVRPLLRGEILAADGDWRETEFLLDTGADCTVLSATTLSFLGLTSNSPEGRLGGLGGTTSSVVLDTQIRLRRETGDPVRFNGQFSAVTELAALDVSVLGRDVTGLFVVIADQPAEIVCLLRGNHRYSIQLVE